MIPPNGTPVADRLSAATWRPTAVTVLQRLRTELHAYRTCPAITYDGGQPRLVVSDELTVWADRAGTVFSWGPSFTEEAVDHAPADDPARVARRIAELLGEHRTEPRTAP
ncbi:hypothetical protein ACIBCT_20175 [Streptosporangium sp. NPDC050855]|uniref:hypothetical protein n=1 Tax=Streptosporangium sp. NPDC050855 TaxID=3366194 RepID=UPI0037A8A156